MIAAAFQAFIDMWSPAFRSVLFKAIGLALALFLAVFVAAQAALALLVAFPWPWLEPTLAVLAGLGLLAAFFFLMSPVTALFAGLYLDEIAALVERQHYPKDAPGTPLNTFMALLTGLQFAGLVLLVNLLVLPTIFFGIGVFALLVANAYLLGREYFELVAMRHMPVDDARRFRRDNAMQVFLAGFAPAAWALVPVINFAVPLFATAYFVHLYKRLAGKSPRTVFAG